MRVSLPKKTLADVLSHIERIIPQRSSNPALSLLRLELAEQSFTLTGSNMELDIRATLKADVESEGIIALPAHVFSQVVRSLPGELVSLEVQEREVHITSGSYHTNLQLSDDSQTVIPDFPPAASYTGSLEANVVSAALGQVRYAAAVAEYQAVMRGVKLELADDKTRAVATNGFRLAYYHSEVSSGLAGELILPAKSVDEITRIFADGTVQLAFEDTTLSLRNAIYSLNVNVMEGEFPNYNAVIPQEFALRVRLDAKELVDIVQRVALMADKNSNNRIDIFVKNGQMQLSAEGGYGRSQEALDVNQEGSESEMLLAYNASFLLEALRPVSGNIYLSFPAPTSPTVLTSEKDSGYLAMVVPLSL